MSLTGKYREIKSLSEIDILSLRYESDNIITIKIKDIRTEFENKITMSKTELKQIIKITKKDKFI